MEERLQRRLLAPWLGHRDVGRLLNDLWLPFVVLLLVASTLPSTTAKCVSPFAVSGLEACPKIPVKSKTFLRPGEKIYLAAKDVTRYVEPDCVQENIDKLNTQSPCRAALWLNPKKDVTVVCTAEKFHSYLAVAKRVGLKPSAYLFENPKNPGRQYVILAVAEGYKNRPHRRAAFCSAASRLLDNVERFHGWLALVAVAICSLLFTT